MANPLIQPTPENIKDPQALLRVLIRFWETLLTLTSAAGAQSPERAASAAGRMEVIVIRGATVTLPGSAETFTADLYGVGVRN